MTEASKVDPLVKRERIDTLPALQALLNTLMLAEAAEKKLQEMQAHIDHADAYHKAMLAAEAERDDYKRSATHSEDVVRAARAEIERLRAIGTEMAESIQGNYYLPGVATRWFTALKGQQPEPWPSAAIREAVDFAEQTFPYLAQKDNSHE
jgi:hypothetical protein